MKVKEYLHQLNWMDKRINALLERKERYKDYACRAIGVRNATRLSGTDQRSQVDDYVCKLIDLESDINRLIDEFVDQTRETERIISSLPDYRHRDILTWRYLNGWSWDKIFETMDYAPTRVFELHGYALREFQKRAE